jgi:alkylation response protein AidB-like acyl-CoA dehydrogenase
MDAIAKSRDYLALAQGLAPLIAAAADEIERARRLPAPVLAAMMDAGLFRLLLPRSLGGGEVDPLTFVQVIEAIAKADASTAWCLCQTTVCSLVAGSLPVESAREIFGCDPHAILAWGAVSDARAVATAGGYRVTGSWSFLSGGWHATWLGAHCLIYEADGNARLGPAGARIARTLLFPAAAATMTDVWQVVGLCGTGSDIYAVTDLFVPEAFTLIRDDPAARRETGTLYCMTTTMLFACGFACVALGVARSLLDALVELALEKTPRGSKTKLRDSALAQSEIATSEARLRGARMYLLGTLGEIWDSVQRSNQLNLDQRMAIRLAATHVIHEAVEVADMAYRAAGATAIFDRNPFERRFRDIHTVAQQLQAQRMHFETVGRYLLGLDADLRFV